MDEAAEDLDLYCKLLAANNVHACLQIEKRWGLDGFPPNVVSSVLSRVADGDSLDEAIDDVLGVQ
jgi:hypothetical protein